MEQQEAKVETPNDQMPEPKIRHDWYQTEANVIITILAKNVSDVKVENTERNLSVSAKLPNGNDYSLEIDLYRSVVPNLCPVKLLPSKLEIKLKKQDGCRWNTLEGTDVKDPVQPIPANILQSETELSKYPSSSCKGIDWNKLEKEIAEEADDKPEGEAAVSALFQKIYGQGSDEVKRAMNKSFMESGGTVLSTNWDEVGRNKVERKPADGVEWKTWN